MKLNENELACHKRQQIDMPRELLCSVGHGQQYSISGDELCLFVARQGYPHALHPRHRPEGPQSSQGSHRSERLDSSGTQK